MKQMLIALLVLGLSSAASAGSITNLNITAKLALNETCNPSECKGVSTVRYKVAMTHQLTAENKALINADTLFQVGLPGTGNQSVMITFRPGDDPNYQTSGTECRIKDTMPGTQLKRQITMSWPDDHIELTLKVSGKIEHVVSEHEAESSRDKGHEPVYGYSFSASNDGPPFIISLVFLDMDLKGKTNSQFWADETTKCSKKIRFKTTGHSSFPFPFPF